MKLLLTIIFCIELLSFCSDFNGYDNGRKIGVHLPQNYFFCRIKLLTEKFGHLLFDQTNQ